MKGVLIVIALLAVGGVFSKIGPPGEGVPTNTEALGLLLMLAALILSGILFVKFILSRAKNKK